MTDNLDQMRAARFAAEWIDNHPGIKSGVYHLSAIEVLAQGGPFCACTITIRLDDNGPQHPLLVKEMAVPA